MGAFTSVISTVSYPLPLMRENPAPLLTKLSCAVATEEMIGPIFYNNSLPAVLATPKSVLKKPFAADYGVYAATTRVAGTEF